MQGGSVYVMQKLQHPHLQRQAAEDNGDGDDHDEDDDAEEEEEEQTGGTGAGDLAAAGPWPADITSFTNYLQFLVKFAKVVRRSRMIIDQMDLQCILCKVRSMQTPSINRSHRQSLRLSHCF